MIRHQAISQRRKLMNSRLLPQLFHEIKIEIALQKTLAPLKAAESKEISSQSYVTSSRETDSLAREGHDACQRNKRLYTINKYNISNNPPRSGHLQVAPPSFLWFAST
jgi:hypothetical protein